MIIRNEAYSIGWPFWIRPASSRLFADWARRTTVNPRIMAIIYMTAVSMMKLRRRLLRDAWSRWVILK